MSIKKHKIIQIISIFLFTQHFTNVMPFDNMAILSKIKSILSASESVNKTLDIVEKGTDGIIAGFDKAFYTDEEKAEALQIRIDSMKELTAMHIQLMEKTGSENTIRSISRRKLAMSIMQTYLFLLLCSAILWQFDGEWSMHIKDIAMILNNLVLAVGFFYFGGYISNQIIDKVKKNN